MFRDVEPPLPELIIGVSDMLAAEGDLREGVEAVEEEPCVCAAVGVKATNGSRGVGLVAPDYPAEVEIVEAVIRISYDLGGVEVEMCLRGEVRGDGDVEGRVREGPGGAGQGNDVLGIGEGEEGGKSGGNRQPHGEYATSLTCKRCSIMQGLPVDLSYLEQRRSRGR